jgi:hypothetical protein
MAELERCEQEIAAIASLLRCGHSDAAGLLLALRDWRTERRLLREEYGTTGDNGEDRLG